MDPRLDIVPRATRPKTGSDHGDPGRAEGRTSCRSARANQGPPRSPHRSCSLILTVRDAIPKARELATAEFATLRLRLLKIAARVVETTSRIRPEADLIALLVSRPWGGSADLTARVQQERFCWVA